MNGSHLDTILGDFSQRFPEAGTFILRRDESIRECTRRNGVPNKYGAYIIFDPSGEVMYIGKSGTVNRDGRFDDQGVRERLSKRQDHEPRQVYFNNRMEELGLANLEIRWFITHDGKHGILPAKAEADLMQAYFDDHGCLPPWNKSI